MSSLRILHVVPTYLPATRYGGPIYATHGLCKALASLGHDVSVLTTSVDGPIDSDVPHQTPVEIDGVKVTYFRSRRLRRIYFAPEMLRAFAHEIPLVDVVHLHAVYLMPGSAAARVAARVRVPYILSAHAALSPEMIAKKSRVAKTAWLQLVERGTLAHAARIHFTSEREHLEARRLRLPLPRPCIVPLGADLPAMIAPEQATPAVRTAIARGKYALFLGRLSWVKGIDRVIDALATTDIRLLVVGVDDEKLKPALERRILGLGLSQRVEFLPAVAGNDKWTLLRCATLLVLASHNENFGLVVAEAMAAGCPVVTVPTVGAADVVRASGGGLVVSPQPAELRAALLRLWSDGELARKLGAAGASYARDHLTWTQIGRAMQRVYEDMLARGDAPSVGIG